MARNLIPRSFFEIPARISSYLPSWEDMGEGVNQLSQWANVESDINVYEDDQNVYIEANLPGLQQQDIDISLYQNTLRIKGEKKEDQEEQDKNKRYYRRSRQRSFFYQINLPTQVEEDTETAEYEDGVLKIKFRKSRQSNVKKIAISKGSRNGNGNKTASTSTSRDFTQSQTNQKTSGKKKR